MTDKQVFNSECPHCKQQVLIVFAVEDRAAILFATQPDDPRMTKEDFKNLPHTVTQEELDQ